MIAATALIIFAVLVAVLGPALLRRSPWLERSPKMGIAMWQALSFSLLSTVTLAGLALALPAIPWTTDLALLIEACAMLLREQYSTPGGAIVSGAGVIAVLVVLGRVAYCLALGLTRSMRTRTTHVQALSLIARPHHQYDALVVEHKSAAAYCLPGGAGYVVLTSAAVAALDHEQLVAVLAHERAHLQGRHHLVLASADALQRAFPRVALFREARSALGPLVEMVADDTAARSSDRLTVATALVRLAEHGMTPAAALGAGGGSAAGRVRRLVGQARPLDAKRMAAAALGVGVVLTLPLFFAVAPASAAGAMPPCTMTSTI